MKRHLFLFLLIITAWSCKKNSVEVKENEEVDFFFRLEAAKNPNILKADIYPDMNGDTIFAIIPYLNNVSSIVVSFTAKNAVVKINGVEQTSGVTAVDFSKPVEYNVVSASGNTRKFMVKVTNTGLPIFNLTTTGPVTSKDVYVNGSLEISPTEKFVQEKLLIPLQIKGRGNSTWNMPKKPYRLKFIDKAKVLGLPSAKNWVLLANYSDKTLLRTSLAFNLGQQVMPGFSPHAIAVEVVMNGEYLGSYQLTEQMEVHENRVNINELKPANTAPGEITGGYFIEQDQRLGEPVYFYTAKGLPMNIKSPEGITTPQLEYIKDYFAKTETAIFAADFANTENGYAKYIDVNSFVNWFIIQELLKNQDAQSFSSIYFQKPRNEKLFIGPIWDFDLAIGNVDYSDATNPTGWWVKNGAWYSRLFQDPAFKQKVVNRWAELKTKEIPGIFTYIDRAGKNINYSQKVNFVKWDILNKYVWPNPVVLGTHENEVTHIKNWLTTRIAWIDDNINK